MGLQDAGVGIMAVGVRWSSVFGLPGHVVVQRDLSLGERLASFRIFRGILGIVWRSWVRVQK